MDKFSFKSLLKSMEEGRYNNIYLSDENVDSSFLPECAISTKSIMQHYLNEVLYNKTSIYEFCKKNYNVQNILIITDMQFIAYKVVSQEVLAELIKQRINSKKEHLLWVQILQDYQKK